MADDGLAGASVIGQGRESGVRAAEHGPSGPRGSGAGDAVGVALGSTQSNCWARLAEVDRRRVRWAARARLWDASSLWAVRTCGRHIVPVAERTEHGAVPVERHGVEVRRRELETGPVAGYAGLTLCGSVWACPRCSAVIAWQRSAEIARAVRRCQEDGGQTFFLTLTLRHRVSDELADLWGLLGKGWRAVVGCEAWSGRAPRERAHKSGARRLVPGVMGDRERFGIAGVVRVVEATVSRPGSGGHGWHLHVHALLFAAGGLSTGLCADWSARLAAMMGRHAAVDPEWLGRVALSSRISARFTGAVGKAGGRVPGVAAVDLRRIEDGGAEYVGSYLAKSTYDVAVRLGAEVATGEQTKTVRETRNLSPFELLADAVTTERFGFPTPRHWEISMTGRGRFELVDTDTGEVRELVPPALWALWLAWEQGSSGRRQIGWSQRPRTFGGCPKSRPAAADAAAVEALDVLWLTILDARGETADKTDEDVARAELDGLTLGMIPRADWYGRMVWHPSWLVEALEAAESGGLKELRKWAKTNGVELSA